MEDRMKRKIVELFNAHILSPVLYMLDDGVSPISLICFCDRNIIMSDIYMAELELREISGRNVEIVDIRAFDTADRLEVMRNAELIYSDNIIVERLFEQSMIEDFEIMNKEREAAQIRYNDNNSPYVQ